jgi:hypothetical protein
VTNPPAISTAAITETRIRVLRRLGTEGRARLMVELSGPLQATVEAGIRLRHADDTPDQVRLALIRLRLGEALFRQCFPDVDVASLMSLSQLRFTQLHLRLQMASEECAATNLEGPTPRRDSRWPVVMTFLLVSGAIGALTVVSWHRHRVDSLREQYRQKYGDIEVPAAIYFDGVAVSVQGPFLLLWFVLQLASALVFCFACKGVGYSRGLLFWSLWLTYCLTLNGASLSRDMAQRCVIVKVKRPDYAASWEEETRAFIQQHRWVIIGDILAALKASAPSLPSHSRWGAWEDAVLARVGDPAECQRVIQERQETVDEDAAEAEIVREALVEELRRRGHAPDREAIWIPSKDLAGITNSAMGDNRPVNKATAYLRTLGIPELRESRRGSGRGWVWRGQNASADAPTVTINQDGWPGVDGNP